MWITPQYFSKDPGGSIDANLSALWKNPAAGGKETAEKFFHGFVEIVKSSICHYHTTDFPLCSAVLVQRVRRAHEAEFSLQIHTGKSIFPGGFSDIL